MRLLLVEDDKSIADTVAAGLSEQGFTVERAASYADGLRAATVGSFDLIVLDLMLPGGSGLDLCATLRSQRVATPILMLTARDAVDDRVRGLEAGGDDYLTKPFAFRELVARLKALGRRRPTPSTPIIRVQDLEVDLAAHRVRRAGHTVDLSAKEFQLLECLVRHYDQVVDRATITAHVWDDNHDPFTNVLEVLVKRLRRKIDDGFEPKLIHTLRGAGYRLGT
jgi:two-component system copper resistance phosphate regulon response regulator CusR